MAFEQLSLLPADPLLALIGAYRDDPRPFKLDLGVGVFRDAAGGTPVMGAVKKAEERLLATQDSKSYLGPEGDAGFVAALFEPIGADEADAVVVVGRLGNDSNEVGPGRRHRSKSGSIARAGCAARRAAGSPAKARWRPCCRRRCRAR